MATVVFPEIATANNAITTLATGIDNSTTTVVVTSAAALGLDNSTTDAYITIIDAANYRKNPATSPETLEIVQVTAVSTNTLTVTRGVDGTSGTAFSAGAIIELRITAAMIQRIYDALTDGADDIAVGGVSVNGDLALAASGVNKAWTKWIPAAEFHNITAASGTLSSGAFNYTVLDFDDTTDELTNFVCDLGDDYDDSSLDLKVYWASDAATSGACRWYIEWDIISHNDPLNYSSVIDSGNFTVAGAAKDINVSTLTLSPTSSGKTFLVARFRRNAGSGADTMVGDSRLIGVSLSYT